MPESITIGAKRNALCAAVKGEIIAHFDDDDFYGLHYIERMVSFMDRPPNRRTLCHATGEHYHAHDQSSGTSAGALGLRFDAINDQRVHHRSNTRQQISEDRAPGASAVAPILIIYFALKAVAAQRDRS